MAEHFIGEAIKPRIEEACGSGDGGPVMPAGFTWRGRDYTVDRVLESWKETGPCRNKSGESYLRKHWYRIRTAQGQEMKIYFQRQPRKGSRAEDRWWLITILEKGIKR
jgi:phosphoribosylglycinamide formyltransferase-1